MVVAQTTVTGEPWGQALSEGFRRLAGYIFGRGASGRRNRIAMTTPVLATRTGDLQDVQFVMPRGSSHESLPLLRRVEAWVELAQDEPTRAVLPAATEGGGP